MHPFAGRFGLLAHLQRWLAGGRAWRFREVLLHSAGVGAPDAGAAPHLHPSRVPGGNWPLTRSFPSRNCHISGDRLGTGPGVFSLCALARLRALPSLRQVWLKVKTFHFVWVSLHLVHVPYFVWLRHVDSPNFM